LVAPVLTKLGGRLTGRCSVTASSLATRPALSGLLGSSRAHLLAVTVERIEHGGDCDCGSGGSSVILWHAGGDSKLSCQAKQEVDS